MDDDRPTSVRLLIGLLWFETALAGLSTAYFLVSYFWSRSQYAAGDDWADLGALVSLVAMVASGVLLIGALVMLSLARHRSPSAPWVTVGLHAALAGLAWFAVGSWGPFAGVWTVLPIPAILAALAPDTRAWFRRRVEAH